MSSLICQVQVATVESPHTQPHMPLVLNERLIGHLAAVLADLGETGVNPFEANATSLSPECMLGSFRSLTYG